MKKKTIAFLLSMIMLVGTLIGCSNESGSEGEGSGSEDEVVKLRMMAYNPESTRTTYLQMLDEKLPNIEIEFEFVALDNFNNVLNAQLQAGEGPDIIEVGGEAKLLAKANYLLDLSDKDFTSKYVDAGLKPYSVDGGIYATPLQSWFEGIFYNKTIFEENGVEVPKTWDELIAISKKLAENGVKPQTMGAQSWEPMMKQSIGLVNNEFYADEANSDFDNKFNEGEAKLAEAWLPAVKEWSKIIDEEILTDDMLGLSYDQALDQFATGKAAMWESGPWAVPTILEKNPDIEIGMFPIPGTEEGPGWLIGGPGSALAINANSDYIDEAIQVLELTATEEAQLALVEDNAGSSFLEGVEVDLGEIYTDSEEAFKAGNVYAPWTAVWTSGNPIVQSYGKSLQEVLAGTKTVKEALQDADETNDNLRQTLN
ncbi:Multiple sugar-binding protein precursor [Paraliobacillus sp. PM-2]|uniref:ABC transporter substrate-binding protein n=1 Tax=Paraliobacillus sp. PM-2 TaxID=1462524 RepID=UPI00061B9A28|nr:extracellular solute-binding protein [Paraliobacillus sp. PM-2]CQR48451.1 Multiple sugar-binding protein precursor [Paraliobacillus sp. PM-2]